MLLILAMVSYVIWYMKREVVETARADDQSQYASTNGQFNHIPLDTASNNELGF